MGSGELGPWRTRPPEFRRMLYFKEIYKIFRGGGAVRTFKLYIILLISRRNSKFLIIETEQLIVRQGLG